MALIGLIPIIGEIIDKIIPDPNKRVEMQLELAKLADQENARASQERIAQTEVNKAEASNSSLFVAGWRPAVGWSCVGGFLYTVVAAPLFHWGVSDVSFLRDVLLGMLGISVGARSYEKVKGVAQNTLTGEPVVKKPGILKKIGRGEWPF